MKKAILRKNVLITLLATTLTVMSVVGCGSKTENTPNSPDDSKTTTLSKTESTTVTENETTTVEENETESTAAAETTTVEESEAETTVPTETTTAKETEAETTTLTETTTAKETEAETTAPTETTTAKETEAETTTLTETTTAKETEAETTAETTTKADDYKKVYDISLLEEKSLIFSIWGNETNLLEQSYWAESAKQTFNWSGDFELLGVHCTKNISVIEPLTNAYIANFGEPCSIYDMEAYGDKYDTCYGWVFEGNGQKICIDLAFSYTETELIDILFIVVAS